MAAPVFDHENDVCAALTIAGPAQRFTEDRRREMLESLLDSACRLSQLLGYVRLEATAERHRPAI
jgi:DNA-binding IclR family transcriptional regulator